MRTRGFTLLEVLVALAVLALSAAALMHQVQQSARLQQQLELKSVALALADSELAAIASSGQWPPLGRQGRQLTAQSLEWEVEAEVQATPSPELRRVEVRVRQADREEGAPLAALTTYLGRY
jgi:general secretion pathway protein I